MSTRGRAVLVASILVVACAVAVSEYLVRAIAVPSFAACQHTGTLVSVAALSADGARMSGGCLAGEPFTPTVRMTDGTLIIGIPPEAAASLDQAERLRVHAAQHDANDLPRLLRLADLLAPTTSVQPAELPSGIGTGRPIELASPRIVRDGTRSRIEFELGGARLDGGTEVAVLGIEHSR